MLFDLITDAVGQVDEVAIEVLAALQFEAPQRCVPQYLFQAYRVSHRHQDDFPLQTALLLQLGQPPLEVPRHQHAGQFVGMQRGLDVHLAATAWAKVEAVQLA
ncbi:hypothetical protein D3C80_1758920 [compost metagenome]